MKDLSSVLTWVVLGIAQVPLNVLSQLPAPTILEVVEDDRLATIYWNSKTNVYTPQYDPDKQAGIYSYLVEWGKVSEGFTNSKVTPYRVHQVQPIEPGVMYQVRVFNLDNFGVKSLTSSVSTFQHDPTRVNAMRNRLNGFFDDMNYPMGPFPERNWNQSYSGCMRIGVPSQHINTQFHGHNVIASDGCDRSIASSRAREVFDFTDRTGTIEFDLDGSKRSRQNWYLDLSDASRKRDLTGHTAIEAFGSPSQSDPPYLLRLIETDGSLKIQLADSLGWLHTLPNMYQNNACGDLFQFCPGENLIPMTNIRRHWKVELSKTWIKIFISDILVVDGSLVTSLTPEGLPYEVAQVNWLFFSYNTPKENVELAMVHWDNFGFDAPAGYQPAKVIHNYTDGKLGTTTAPAGNDGSAGLTGTVAAPATVTIPIPDPIDDLAGNDPLMTELMFTMQGGGYAWTASDRIVVNGHNYPFPQPQTDIPSFAQSELISTIRPHSVILPIDPNHLISGSNMIQFHLNDPRLLNIHIEVTYPVAQEPAFTEPIAIHANHMSELMSFHSALAGVGPGVVFEEVDETPMYMNEFAEVHSNVDGSLVKYIKMTPVSDSLHMVISGNCDAQMIASGSAQGIAYYEILIDNTPVLTVPVNAESPVAFFYQEIGIDTKTLTNGIHELFVRGYDVNGVPSAYDAFQAHADFGEYIPIEFEVENVGGAFDVRVFLEGPYDATTGLMHDSLRVQGSIPLTEPYSALGFPQVGSGGETVVSSVLTTQGANAVVDWVHIELRSLSDATVIQHTYNALLLRNGTVVTTDGINAILIPFYDHDHYLTVRHRNHLGVMTNTPVLTDGFGALIDFTLPATATFGTEALKNIGGVNVMWAGETIDDSGLRYTGTGNDRDPVLVEIGGMVPTNTAAGYLNTDVNMDGVVKYTGTNNDRDPILVNIGGAVPTNTRVEQLP